MFVRYMAALRSASDWARAQVAEYGVKLREEQVAEPPVRGKGGFYNQS
jgi:hypothetical protein